jgi:hypothetical protein
VSVLLSSPSSLIKPPHCHSFCPHLDSLCPLLLYCDAKMPHLLYIGDSSSGPQDLSQRDSANNTAVGNMLADTNNHNNNDGDNKGINSRDIVLPPLKSIWDCNQINKGLVPGADSTSVAGWTCGWCPGGRSFKEDNATKALAHVAKISGKNVQFCKGNIPMQKVVQYRNLWMEKSSARLDRSARSALFKNGISNLQSRRIQSMGGGSSESGNVADAVDLMLVDSTPAQKRAHNSIHPSSAASGGSINHHDHNPSYHNEDCKGIW